MLSSPAHPTATAPTCASAQPPPPPPTQHTHTHLRQRACAVVLDLVVAEVQLRQPLVLVLPQPAADEDRAVVAQRVAAQVQLRRWGVWTAECVCQCGGRRQGAGKGWPTMPAAARPRLPAARHTTLIGRMIPQAIQRPKVIQRPTCAMVVLYMMRSARARAPAPPPILHQPSLSVSTCAGAAADQDNREGRGTGGARG